MKVVAVASGKGGVGKSTVSLNLARALADRGRSVGLLDADVYGPDIPLMLGIKRTRELRSWLLGRDARFGGVVLEPVERLGLKVMSVGFLLAEHQALTMPAQLVDLVARQLIEDVEWGDLDYLIVDLPPGTADLQQQLFTRSRLAGAIIVVGPQDVAHLDARKLVTMLRDAGVPILGAVENMSALECPHCGEPIEVFPPVADERSVLREIPLLGQIPLDPAYARLNGVPPACAAIADRVEHALA
ncbi:MAG TPA: P-loop NTPase [Gaiellaceae bacterium]|jgi:ATP-binding protein involved in chromosome partitioning